LAKFGARDDKEFVIMQDSCFMSYLSLRVLLEFWFLQWNKFIQRKARDQNKWLFIYLFICIY